MQELLRLSLLGSPQIFMGDQPQTGFTTNKAQALLFYLAVSAQADALQLISRSRDVLATLLWGEMTEVKAKQNLRSVLPNLRRLVGNHLQIERQTIAFDHTTPYWLDVTEFQRVLTPSAIVADLDALQTAVNLYRGEFLSGFYVHNAPVFEAWVLQQRERLHNLMVKALFALVDGQIQQSNYSAALSANRRLLLLEPWSEPAHRQQMLLLAQTGERSAALAQYEACREILAAEFKVEPLAETVALYEQIRAGGAREQQDTGLAAAVGAVKEPEASDYQPIFVNEHDLPPPIKLFGRQQETEHLQKWVNQDGCRLVGILGIGGQGKSTLAAALVRSLVKPDTLLSSPNNPPGRFQNIIWKSLLNAPPLDELLQEWIYLLSGQTVTSLPDSLDQQLSQLLDYLREQRSMLILDNLESILQSNGRSGYYRPGYEAYGQLMRRLVQGQHQSCLLLTSRERSQDLTHLEEDTPAVRFLSLAGLSAAAGQQMLAARGVGGDVATLTNLVQHYSGNPLALKLAADTVDSLFDGNMAAFLRADTRIFDDIRDILDQQFTRLGPLEREMIIWLAIVREPVSYAVLRGLLAQPPAPRLMMEAVRSLQRRSLLERYETGFGLQNVVLEYSTDLLIENIVGELLNHKRTEQRLDPFSPSRQVNVAYINCFALILAQTKEYVRASQRRLLLQPVAEQLTAQLGSRGAEQQLKKLLSHLHDAPLAPGYAAANLLHLLLYLEVDLRGADFSQLYLRQLYLRGESLPQINFAQAEIVDSVFTEPFGIVNTAVFSPDGRYLAAGTNEGAIYIWRTAGQQLTQTIEGHGQAVNSLMFAQGEDSQGGTQLMLASAGGDKRIGLWLLDERGQKRRHYYLEDKRQGSLLSVGLNRDGGRVTAVDGDGHVFVWEISNQAKYQLVQDFITTPTRLCLIAYSEDGQTIAVGNREGLVNLHQVTTGKMEQVVVVETGPITAVALSRDGRTLVTGGREGSLCFWAIPAGQLQQVIKPNDAAIDALAFSANGKMLASTHGVGDQTVRLWEKNADSSWQLRHTLTGHRHIIWSVAFGPPPVANATGKQDSGQQLLVTGSSDQTVRVWDGETGHALYTQRGQPRALSAIAIRPFANDQPVSAPETNQEARWLLAAVGYDRLVHLWTGRDAEVEAPPRTLRGSRNALYAVDISPNGRILAGAGHDKIVYLWDIATGQLLQSLAGHTNSIYNVAFCQDGDLLASSSINGLMCLWHISHLMERPGYAATIASPNEPDVVRQAHPHGIYDMAISTDGRILAYVGTDLTLRFWDMTQSHYPELVEIGKAIKTAGEQDILSVAFDSRGTKVACGGHYTVHLWQLYGSESPQVLRQHTSWVMSLAFSPDGAILASGSADSTICLWDVISGELHAILRGHNDTVYKIAFSPDGALVLSCSFDGTIKFWDVLTWKCVNTVVVDGPYARMNITGISGVTEAQKAALKALGAIEKGAPL